MHYTYILKSINHNKLYIGSTEDLKKRLIKHNSGKSRFTKAYIPWKLVYCEGHLTRKLAMRAELFYKTGQGRRHSNKKLDL